MRQVVYPGDVWISRGMRGWTGGIPAPKAIRLSHPAWRFGHGPPADRGSGYADRGSGIGVRGPGVGDRALPGRRLPDGYQVADLGVASKANRWAGNCP